MKQHYYQLDITKEDFKRALLKKGLLNDDDLDLLKFHYLMPNYGATATELSVSLNYKKYTAVNLHFARISKKIANYTGKYPYKGKSGKFWWWTLLANGKSDGRFFIWILRQELVEAIKEINLVKNEILPEQISDKETNLAEGLIKQIKVNAFERNPIARKKCIEFHKSICCVCSFDFEKIYGKLGKGFIHVHHIKPVSKINKKYIIDPIKDLRPLCPNCHAMIHRTDKVLTIKELIEIVNNSIHQK